MLYTALIKFHDIQRDDIALDLGVAYIAGALDHAGIEFSLLEENELKAMTARADLLVKMAIGRVLFLVAGILDGENYIKTKLFCQHIKKNHPSCPVFMGGALATFCSEIVLEHFMLDGIFVGDAHKSVLELATAIENGEDWRSCCGMGYKKNGKIFYTRPLPRDAKLNLPMPAFYKFEMNKYIAAYNNTGRFWNVIGSKGCVSKCAYCTRAEKFLRFRQVEGIMEEIKLLNNQYGINRFNFVDDNFLLNRRFLRRIVSNLQQLPFPILFRFQGRVDILDEPLIVALKAVGLSGISFGIESGSQHILDEMNKGISVVQADYALALCREHEVPYHATFILGMPSESDQTVDETYKFLKRNSFTDNYRVCFLTLFPGTLLYDTARSRGLIENEDAYCSSMHDIYENISTNLTSYSTLDLYRWMGKLTSLKKR